MAERIYRQQKAALTRAINSGDPLRITAECRRAFEEFKRSGWPDDWSRWQRAEEDALMDIANPWRRSA